MAPAQKTAEILIKYEADRSSVNSVMRANDAIISDVKQMNNGYRQLADGTFELTDATRAWSDVLPNLENELNGVKETVEETRQEWKEAREEFAAPIPFDEGADRSRPTRPSSRASSESTTSSRLNTVDRLGRVGTQISSGLGASGLGNTLGLVGDVADAFGSLNPVLGATAVGAAVAAIALGDFQASLERGNQIVESFADGLVAALQAGTRDAIQALIDVEESRIEVAKVSRDLLIREAQGAQTDLEAGLASTVDATNDAAQNVGLAIAQFITGAVIVPTGEATLTASQYGAQIEEQVQVINNAQSSIDAYNTVLASNTSLIEDTTAAELDLGDARDRGEIDTKDMIAEERAAIAAREEASRRYVDQLLYNEKQALEAVTEASERYAQQLEYEQKQALEAVTEASRHYADQLNYEAKQAALRNEETAREDYVKSIAEEAKLAADAAEAHDKYREGLGDTAEQLAEAETERQLALSDIQDDYQREAVEAAEDLNDELVKITRDASDQLQDAVADRDALAFVQAKRQRDKDLQDAKQQDEKESRRRQQEFQREYNEEVRASNIRYQHLLQSERRETETRYQAYQQSLQQLAQASGQKLNLEQQYNNATLAAAGNFANQLRATYLSAFPTKGSIPTKGGGGKTLTIDFRGAQMPAFIAASKQQVFNELGAILDRQYGVK